MVTSELELAEKHLSKSPRAFLAGFLLGVAVTLAVMFYLQSEQLKTRDDTLSLVRNEKEVQWQQLQRYKQALGINSESEITTLSPLTNSELRQKALNWVKHIRNLISTHEKASSLLRDKRTRNEISEAEFKIQRDRQLDTYTEVFTVQIQAEALTVDTELRRRLPSSVIRRIPKMFPDINPSDGGPSISMHQLFAMRPFNYLMAEGLANNIEQMARALSV